MFSIFVRPLAQRRNHVTGPLLRFRCFGCAAIWTWIQVKKASAVASYPKIRSRASAYVGGQRPLSKVRKAACNEVGRECLYATERQRLRDRQSTALPFALRQEGELFVRPVRPERLRGCSGKLKLSISVHAFHFQRSFPVPPRGTTRWSSPSIEAGLAGN